MSFLNLFGSESKTQQTAYNQQVGASQGSIAFGAQSSGNAVNIMTADPAVLEAALTANEHVALGSTGMALGFARDVTGAAIGGVTGTANLSIAAANDLASKFMAALGRQYQAGTDFASSALVQSTNAQQAALAASLNAVSALSGQVANISAAQTPGGQQYLQSGIASDTTFKIVLVAGAALVLFALLKK